MKIATHPIAFILLSLQLASIPGQAQAVENGKVGRFQLFQGTYSAIDGKNNRSDKEQAVFLVDTETGKVKKYLTGLDSEGHLIEKWIEINDSTQGKGP